VLRFCTWPGILIVSAAVAAPATAQQTETISRSLPLPPDGAVFISNVSGDISVDGVGGRDVHIEAIKRVRDGGDAEALADVQVEITARGDRIEVRTEYPRGRRRARVSVDYTVRVPRDARLSARSVSGKVRIRSVDGESRAESVSGDLDLASLARVVQAKTVSGDVRLAGVGSDRDLSVDSVSGSVTAREVRASRLDLRTVSGDLDIDDVRCTYATIETVSGDVSYLGALARNGRYDLRAHSGDVELAIGDDIGFELDARSFSGRIRTDLPVTTTATDTRRALLRGRFRDGGARVDIITFSGDVVIRRRDGR